MLQSTSARALVGAGLAALSIHVASLQGAESVTVWVPNAFAADAGNWGTAAPFVYPIAGLTGRLQQVIAASEFAELPEGGPITALQLRFRMRGSFGFFRACSSGFQINLSTTQAQPDQLSTNFASNIGPDERIVFGPGRLDFENQDNETPSLRTIVLQTPFLYQPSMGNLLLDARNLTGCDCGLGLYEDGQGDAVYFVGDSVSRVESSDAIAPSGRADSGGFIVGLRFEDVVRLVTTNPPIGARESRYFRILGPVATSIQTIGADGNLTWTNTPTNTTFTIQSLGMTNRWVDYVRVPASNAITVHRIFDLNPPPGMMLVPAGSFAMGDSYHEIERYSDMSEIPVHEVMVSAMYMDRFEVTKQLWEEVHQWGLAHGYTFERLASGTAADHPIEVLWHDAAKWCNARSERDGMVPAYYTSPSQTTVYRSGRIDLQHDFVKWDRGFRLPTEAEWEKAARGGVQGKRFPWGGIITHDFANYYSNPRGTYYDWSHTQGYHPIYGMGTSPAGAFAPNGYGLFDVIGNVAKWCFDRYGPYSPEPALDPRGPSTGTYRVKRGEGRVSDRSQGELTTEQGFRCVLPRPR